MRASRHEDRVDELGVPVERRVAGDKLDLDDILAANQALWRDQDVIVGCLELKGPAVDAGAAEQRVIPIDEIDCLSAVRVFEREANRRLRCNRFILGRRDAEGELISYVLEVGCAPRRQVQRHAWSGYRGTARRAGTSDCGERRRGGHGN